MNQALSKVLNPDNHVRLRGAVMAGGAIPMNVSFSAHKGCFRFSVDAALIEPPVQKRFQFQHIREGEDEKMADEGISFALQELVIAVSAWVRGNKRWGDANKS